MFLFCSSSVSMCCFAFFLLFVFNLEICGCRWIICSKGKLHWHVGSCSCTGKTGSSSRSWWKFLRLRTWIGFWQSVSVAGCSICCPRKIRNIWVGISSRLRSRRSCIALAPGLFWSLCIFFPSVEAKGKCY